MKKYFKIIGWCFLYVICCCANACEVIDDTGRVIKLAHPARRIISLAPDLTELLFAAGAGDYVVGVMRGSDYPAQAKRIPVVASFNAINMEQVWGLRPDLIVAWTEGRLPSQLKTASVPLYLSQPHKITDIARTLRNLGCLAGTEKTANQAAEKFLEKYNSLRKKYSHKKTISTFYQIGSNPLMTVSRSSWIDEVISLCGGKNIFADLLGAAPEVNQEEVIMKNPTVMIASLTQHDWKRQWEAWPQLNAVKHQFLFSVNPDWIERAGPRLLDGAEDICRSINAARDE